MSVTEYDIDKAYRLFTEAKTGLYDSSENAIFYRWCRDLSFAKDIATGKLQGKNADERASNHRSLRPRLYKRLADAEKNERDAKFVLDIASVNVEKLRMVMRLMEVTSDARLRTTSV